MTKITIAGEIFNVRLEGDETKEVVALAHQLGGSLAAWEAVTPTLLKHFRVLRWDSRGHGASVANAGPYSIAMLARDAIAIFDALGIEKAHWIGVSMGAMVGQAAMIAAPHRIGRAVLASTAAQYGAPDVWNARIGSARRDGMESMADSVAARWFTPAYREAEPEAVEATLAIFRATSPQGYAAACAALRDADQREAIRAIRNKALVIAGRYDASAPPALGASVASAIEDARVIVLDASHISQIEQSEAFAAAVVDFLTAPERPAQTIIARKSTAPRQMRAPRARQPLARRIVPKPAKKAAASKSARAPAASKKTVVKKNPVKAPVKKPPARTAAKKKPTPAGRKSGQASTKLGAGKAAQARTAVKKPVAKKNATKSAAPKAAVTAKAKLVRKKASAAKTRAAAKSRRR